MTVNELKSSVVIRYYRGDKETIKAGKAVKTCKYPNINIISKNGSKNEEVIKISKISMVEKNSDNNLARK